MRFAGKRQPKLDKYLSGIPPSRHQLPKLAASVGGLFHVVPISLGEANAPL
jgi:hypothetical protein